MRAGLALAAMALAGCGSELVEPGQLYLVHGDEPDPFLQSPEVKRVVVERVADSGKATTIVDQAAPPSRIELSQGGIASFRLEGTDASDALRVYGRSIPIQTAGVAALSLPLFVSRTGAFARAPGQLQGQVGQSPALAMVGGRFLFGAGGADGERAGTDSYDLGVWAPIKSPLSLGCPTPPCRILSVASVETTLLAVGSDWAIWVDLANGSNGEAEPPSGLGSWAGIAGGRTVDAGQAGRFIVGPTREGEPSNLAVRLTAELELETITLATRAGAAASWVSGRGLAVVGGSDSSAGVEIVAPGSTAGVVLPYPPDPTTGAALVARDDRVWRVGGRSAGADAPSVELSLICGSNCTAAQIGNPLSLGPCQAFDRAGEVLIVGVDAAGKTRAKAGLDGASIPLRVPRSGGSALALPTGHIALLGGTADNGGPVTQLELFAPEN